MINGNKQNLEPGEEPDIKDSGINGKNQINENNSNNNENDIKANNDDENNNIDQNLNFEAKKENVEEKEIGEIYLMIRVKKPLLCQIEVIHIQNQPLMKTGKIYLFKRNKKYY